MDKKHVSDFYDKFVEHQKHIGINARHLSILKKSVKKGLRKSDEVLEVGCGIGTFTKLLSNYITDGNIIAVDISNKSIELAKENFQKKRNVSFKVLNLVNETIDKQFDAIILPDVIEHIPLDEHKTLFMTLGKILKDTGNIFIHIPNPYYLEWCISNKPEVLQIIDQPIYTEKLVSNLLDSNLHIHSMQTYSIWIEDGDYQFIVLKKDEFQDFTKKQKPSLLTSLHIKLRRILHVNS